MKRWKAALLVVAVSVALVAVTTILKMSRSTPSPVPAPTTGEVKLGVEKVNWTESSVIRADTPVYWVTRYTICGHEEVRVDVPDKPTVGRTFAEFAQFHQGYKMLIKDDHIEMERIVYQYCPDHYIVLPDGDDGELGLFRNVDGNEELERICRLRYSRDQLSADLQKQLDGGGIAYGSVEELETLLKDVG